MAMPLAADRTSVQSWRRWIELWYAAYALLGATVAGLVPILLPLIVSRSGTAVQVGLVMAAVSLGGLSAPLWGSLADRFRLHRALLIGGLLAVTVALIAFALIAAPVGWVLLALLAGAGSAGAGTVANLFVVESHPQDEWDRRIGWLQTFYGGGQVAGLLIAGVLGQSLARAGLLTAAGLTAVAIAVAWRTVRTAPAGLAIKPTVTRPAQHGEWSVGSPQRVFHHLSAEAIRQLRPALFSPFGYFLLIWLLSFAGAAAIFSLYPVLMQQAFGVTPAVSSAAFAVAAGLGMALYSPAGRWSDRLGAAWVLRAGLGLRAVAFAGLLSLMFVHGSGAGWEALIAFALVVLAWSLLSVSSTALTAVLSPIGEGAGLGVYNAISAIAGVVGALLGGWAAGLWGYGAAAGLALAGAAVGLVLSLVRPFGAKQ